MVSQCQATNASGRPCAAHVGPGETYCGWHDPNRANDRKQWAAKGGKNKSNKARLLKAWDTEQLTSTQLAGLISAAMIGVYEGRLDPGVLSALASGARALHGVHQIQELERAIAAIEAHDTQSGGVA